MTSPIEFVVLDMGGVVCAFAPERRLRTLSDLTGRSPGQVKAVLFGSGLEGRAEKGDLTHEQVYEAVTTELGVALEPEQVRQAWARAFLPDAELLGVVRRVRRPTALFTNNGPIIEDCLSHELSSVTTAFDRLLVSWRLGCTKPQPEAFEKATAALGAKANSVLFVDDELDNVRAAARAGWIAHRFRGNARLRDLFEAHGLLPRI
jgi:HAD superfamily hydrolase (TIGR01509 family)